MNTKMLYKITALVILATMVLTACGTAATAAPTTAPTELPAATAAPAATEAATVAPTAVQPTADATVYRIATDATYPPFETVDETTKALVGFDMDLFKAVADAAGIKYELINVNFDALLAGMAQCQYDAAISAMTITEERKKSFLFTDGYIPSGQIVTINTQTTDIKSVDDLKNKTIGVQIATTGAIAAGKIEGAKVKTYDTVDLAFQDLINRQVDAVVADYPTSLDYVKQNAGKIVTTGDVFTDEHYGIAVCKTETALLDKLNAGLKQVQATSTIKDLTAKWLIPQQ
jgi:polar amino acid transport system substrate-binding protein